MTSREKYIILYDALCRIRYLAAKRGFGAVAEIQQAEIGWRIHRTKEQLSK